MKSWIQLIRPHQWYKNLLVFLALIFSGNLGRTSFIESSIIAFASFCAISSATYILNDFADRKADRLNPEKKNRPLAAGTISNLEAIFLFAAMFTLAVSF